MGTSDERENFLKSDLWQKSHQKNKHPGQSPMKDTKEQRYEFFKGLAVEISYEKTWTWL